VSNFIVVIYAHVILSKIKSKIENFKPGSLRNLNLFMQNKPILMDTKMTVNLFITKYYEKPEVDNDPKQTQNKPNFAGFLQETAKKRPKSRKSMQKALFRLQSRKISIKLLTKW